MPRLFARTGAFVVTLLTGLAGCARSQESALPAEHPAGYRHAYAAPSCAPWDGFAVSLVLREDSLAPGDSTIEHGEEPQLRVGLYPRNGGGRGPSGLSPGTYQWPDEPEVAGGARCKDGRCEGAPKGRVIITEVGPDGSFNGALEVLLKTGDTIRGGFQAAWRKRSILCS